MVSRSMARPETKTPPDNIVSAEHLRTLRQLKVLERGLADDATVNEMILAMEVLIAANPELAPPPPDPAMAH